VSKARLDERKDESMSAKTKGNSSCEDGKKAKTTEAIARNLTKQPIAPSCLNKKQLLASEGGLYT